MRLIEEQVPAQLDGVLPKEYAKSDKDLLADLVRIFNRDELRTATSDDLFGRIYEYFLNKFAMSGAQEGGEFFTPPSLVRTIVNFIEPTHGKVLDPACGSGGMFVQAAHAITKAGKRVAEDVTFHGREKAETNTRLARMNLAVHGIEGDIQQGRPVASIANSRSASPRGFRRRRMSNLRAEERLELLRDLGPTGSQGRVEGEDVRRLSRTFYPVHVEELRRDRRGVDDMHRLIRLLGFVGDPRALFEVGSGFSSPFSVEKRR